MFSLVLHIALELIAGGFRVQLTLKSALIFPNPSCLISNALVSHAPQSSWTSFSSSAVMEPWPKYDLMKLTMLCWLRVKSSGWYWRLASACVSMEDMAAHRPWWSFWRAHKHLRMQTQLESTVGRPTTNQILTLMQTVRPKTDDHKVLSNSVSVLVLTLLSLVTQHIMKGNSSTNLSLFHLSNTVPYYFIVNSTLLFSTSYGELYLLYFTS